jgi:hypothetical protein
MLQHEILMLISAPLLVLSRSLVTFLWALPLEWRQNLGRWSKKQAIARSWSFLTAAFTAWLIHAVAIWAWNAPYLFQLTLRSELAHTRAASQFLSDRSPVLVGGFLCARTQSVWRRFSVGLHHRDSHGNSRRAAHLFSTRLVSRLRQQHAGAIRNAERRP